MEFFVAAGSVVFIVGDDFEAGVVFRALELGFFLWH